MTNSHSIRMGILPMALLSVLLGFSWVWADERVEEPAVTGAPAHVDPAILEAIFRVEAGPRSGSGFLVDSSGLVLTSRQVVGRSRHATVVLSNGERYPARVLVANRGNNVAVIQVHEQVVARIRPLRLAPAARTDGSSQPEGEIRVFSVRAGGYKEAVRAKRAGGSMGNICYASTLPFGVLGGPVLDEGDNVIGIHAIARPSARKRPKTCAFKIDYASRPLALPRETMATADAPLFTALEAEVRESYPVGLAREASERITDPAEYRMRAGEVSVEFITPPLIQALPRTRDDSYTPQSGFYLWQRFQNGQQPVVIVQALPDLRWTGGSAWRVAGYSLSWGVQIVSLPFLLLFSLFTGEADDVLFMADIPPPHAAYRFERDLDGFALVRDGVEVHPLSESLECDPNWVRVARKEGGKLKERKVRGCRGLSMYSPEAFAPGAQLAVRILHGGKPVKKGDVPVDPALAARIWADFEPWRAAVTNGIAADPAPAPPAAEDAGAAVPAPPTLPGETESSSPAASSDT